MKALLRKKSAAAPSSSSPAVPTSSNVPVPARPSSSPTHDAPPTPLYARFARAAAVTGASTNARPVVSGPMPLGKRPAATPTSPSSDLDNEQRSGRRRNVSDSSRRGPLPSASQQQQQAADPRRFRTTPRKGAPPNAEGGYGGGEQRRDRDRERERDKEDDALPPLPPLLPSPPVSPVVAPRARPISMLDDPFAPVRVPPAFSPPVPAHVFSTSPGPTTPSARAAHLPAPSSPSTVTLHVKPTALTAATASGLDTQRQIQVPVSAGSPPSRGLTDTGGSFGWDRDRGRDLGRDSGRDKDKERDKDKGNESEKDKDMQIQMQSRRASKLVKKARLPDPPSSSSSANPYSSANTHPSSSTAAYTQPSAYTQTLTPPQSRDGTSPPQGRRLSQRVQAGYQQQYGNAPHANGHANGYSLQANGLVSHAVGHPPTANGQQQPHANGYQQQANGHQQQQQGNGHANGYQQYGNGYQHASGQQQLNGHQPHANGHQQPHANGYQQQQQRQVNGYQQPQVNGHQQHHDFAAAAEGSHARTQAQTQTQTQAQAPMQTQVQMQRSPPPRQQSMSPPAQSRKPPSSSSPPRQTPTSSSPREPSVSPTRQTLPRQPSGALRPSTSPPSPPLQSFQQQQSAYTSSRQQSPPPPPQQQRRNGPLIFQDRTARPGTAPLADGRARQANGVVNGGAEMRQASRAELRQTNGANGTADLQLHRRPLSPSADPHARAAMAATVSTPDAPAPPTRTSPPPAGSPPDHDGLRGAYAHKVRALPAEPSVYRTSAYTAAEDTMTAYADTIVASPTEQRPITPQSPVSRTQPLGSSPDRTRRDVAKRGSGSGEGERGEEDISDFDARATALPTPSGTSEDVRPATGDDIRPATPPPEGDQMPTPPTPEDYARARNVRRGRGLEKSLPAEVAEAAEHSVETVYYPLLRHLEHPDLLAGVLTYVTFAEWLVLWTVSKRTMQALQQNRGLREAALERFLGPVGYARWQPDTPEPLPLTLKELNAYMRGVSVPPHAFVQTAHAMLRGDVAPDTARHMKKSTRAYNRVLLRLRAQAEAEAQMAAAARRALSSSSSERVGRQRHQGPPPAWSGAYSHSHGRSLSRNPSRAPSPTNSAWSHSQALSHSQSASQSHPPLHAHFSAASPLFRPRRAPLLRVFVPSADGDWLGDDAVLECESELRKAGVVALMRPGDVVWDTAVGDEGNAGRLVWDGRYLIDLDYTYSLMGDMPRYLPSLAFPPSYFHRVVRIAGDKNPIVHIDVAFWASEIATNLQLLQDRIKTETPQGSFHTVVRWVHRSSFTIRHLHAPHAPVLLLPSREKAPIDQGWYGTVVVEAEGTNEGLADLQQRCKGGFPPSAAPGHALRKGEREFTVWRILRERSRPGEIWIRAVSYKERLNP